jgi:hypothetical protein
VKLVCEIVLLFMGPIELPRRGLQRRAWVIAEAMLLTCSGLEAHDRQWHRPDSRALLHQSTCLSVLSRQHHGVLGIVRVPRLFETESDG